jgi:hypothetical protein
MDHRRRQMAKNENDSQFILQIILLLLLSKYGKDGTCNRHGLNKNVCNSMAMIPQGKAVFGTPTYRLEDNIKIDLTEIVYKRY